MIYKKKNYSWVNEKEVNGVLIKIYRCDDKPQVCIKVVDKKVKKVISNKDMNKEWRQNGKVHSNN